MEQLETLSETMIAVLKEFSTEKRALTAASLKEALAARKEVLALIGLAAHGASEKGVSESAPAGEPAGASRETTEGRLLEDVRRTFGSMLENLGPMVKGKHEKQYSELQNKISNCATIQALSRIGERLGKMIGALMGEAVERLDYANDFLLELGKDLYKMEERLSMYGSYGTQTDRINNSFNSNLLTETANIHSAFESGKSLKEVRGIITAKLHIISKAIESKQQSDELRQREADAKISVLRDDLKTYEQEIVQVRERCESLEKEVFLDELMQIGNRRAYDLQIKEDLRRHQRNGEKFSLVLMDVDRFKTVNDNYGHKAGDNCLKEIAQLTKGCLRQSDFLARFGGEELIAVLHGCDASGARVLAEKIRSRIEKAQFLYQKEVIPVTVSLGVTEVAPSDTDSEILFARVDEAMYRAKKEGRNRVRVSTEPPCGKMPDHEASVSPVGGS